MFAEKIKKLRNEKNISQLKLAKLLFISQQAYAKYELGQATPTYETLVNLSHIFEVSIDFLLDNDFEYFEESRREREKNLLEKFRKLNDKGQMYIFEQLDFAISKSEYKNLFQNMEEKDA